MENIGYILSYKDFEKHYYNSQYGITDNPFDADFYINKEDAIKISKILSGFHKQDIEIIKVKKTISIIE